MTVLLTETFESGGFGAGGWTASAMTVVAGGAKAGTYSARTNGVAGAEGSMFPPAFPTIVTNSETFVRFYVRLYAEAAANGTIILGDFAYAYWVLIAGSSESGGARRLRIGDADAALVAPFGGVTSDWSETQLALGVWYRVEIRMVLSDTAGELELRLYEGDSPDAIETLLIDPCDTERGSQITDFIWGDATTSGWHLGYDDIRVDYFAAAGDNPWIGASNTPLESNEPIGTTARLGVARLGGTRLGAIPRDTQLTTTGTYAWLRSDGAGGEVNDGRHPDAAAGGWTTVRS